MIDHANLGADLPPRFDEAMAKLRRKPVATWLDLSRDDQSRRWRSDRGVFVEEYLKELPELRHNSDDTLVLICGEMQLRDERGEHPSLDEYQTRFPEFYEELALQFEINRQLEDVAVHYDSAVVPIDESEGLRGYKILNVVGCGASSVVYRAWQLSPQRVVAIKSLASWNLQPKRQERHLREAEALAAIQHPNVVRIYETVQKAGRLHLVMEYVDGPSLAEHAAGRSLEARAAAQLLASLAEAIAVVHSAGVLHRDLKPANILLSPNGVPIITDFGLAKWIGAGNGATTEYTLLGTPSYMAPEQAAGGSDAAAPTADIYSLGSILYELLTGQPPFAGKSLLETLTAIREQEIVPPRTLRPTLAPDLETIVLTATAKNPEHRYATASAMANDLRLYLADEPIHARRVGTMERYWRWCRRNPEVATLLAALGGAIAMGLAGVGWQWRDAVRARKIAEQKQGVADHAWRLAAQANEITEHLRAAEESARNESNVMSEKFRTEKERLEQAFVLLEQARIQIALRHWDEAFATYSEVIALQPEMADAIEERGQQFLRLHLIDLAAADIQQAFSLRKPFHSWQWTRHGLLCLHSGDHATYARSCGLMRKKFSASGSPKVIFDLVRICSAAPESGVDAVSTAAMAESAIVRFRNQQTLRILALAYYRAARYEESAATCLRSIATAEDYAEFAYPVLAMAEFQLGRRLQARQSLSVAEDAYGRWLDQMAEATDEQWAVHQGATANWPIDQVDWLEFLLHLHESQQLLGVVPANDARTYVLRARTFAGLRRPIDALAAYDQALRIAPDDPRIRLETHRVRGFRYVTEYEFRLAAEEYNAAIQLASDDSNLWRFLAISYLAAEDIAEYQNSCRAMLHHFAGTSLPHVAADLVEVCACRSDSLSDGRELLPYGELAAQHLPDSVRFMAAAQFRADQPEASVATFKQLERFCRLRAVDLLTLSLVHHRLGQMAQAYQRYEEAVAWIEEANQNTATSPVAVTRARWGAWPERIETDALKSEADIALRH